MPVSGKDKDENFGRKRKCVHKLLAAMIRLHIVWLPGRMLHRKIDRQTEEGVGFANMAFSVLRDMNKLSTTMSIPE